MHTKTWLGFGFELGLGCRFGSDLGLGFGVAVHGGLLREEVRSREI